MLLAPHIVGYILINFDVTSTDWEMNLNQLEIYIFWITYKETVCLTK